jgi:uncharacterized membrane protein
MAVQIGPEDPNQDYVETVEHISSLLNLGSMWFTLGIRGYYFAIPYLFWYFGPYQLLISTVLLIAAVTYADSNTLIRLTRNQSRELIV